MKIKFLSIVLSVFFFNSCISTKVSSKNNYDYSILKPNSKYIVETKDGNKIRQFEYLNEKENLIIGKQEGKEIQIEKNNINKILKFSAGKTIPLIVGGIGVAILLPAYIKNEPVGK